VREKEEDEERKKREEDEEEKYDMSSFLAESKKWRKGVSKFSYGRRPIGQLKSTTNAGLSSKK